MSWCPNITNDHTGRCSRACKGFECKHRRETQANKVGGNPPKPRPARLDGHTHEWDKQSLGLVEANILRMAWGPERAHFVTRNPDS